MKSIKHARRGIVNTSAANAARKLVNTIRKRVGKDKYPTFFDSEFGKAIEAPLFCTILLEIAERYEIPGDVLLAKFAAHALEGCAGDLNKYVESIFSPLLADLGGLALAFGFDEEQEDEEEDDEE